MRFSSGDVLDGVSHMERDYQLLEDISSVGIAARVYGWSEPWITLGKFQDPKTDLLAGCQVPYAMRPTGGRAVLHGHDITIGLAISLIALACGDEVLASRMSRSVRFAYRGAVRPIIIAMQACGFDAALGEEIKGVSSGPKSADCFAHLSANDVVNRLTLKKACGVAMLLTQDAVLLQASLPVAPPLIDPATIYAAPSEANWHPISCVAFALEFERALMAGLVSPIETNN